MRRLPVSCLFILLLALPLSGCLFGDSLTLTIMPQKAATTIDEAARAEVRLYEYDPYLMDAPADLVHEEVFELSSAQRKALLDGDDFDLELDDISREEDRSYYVTVRIDVDDDGFGSCPDYFDAGFHGVDWDQESINVTVNACPDQDD